MRDEPLTCGSHESPGGSVRTDLTSRTPTHTGTGSGPTSNPASKAQLCCVPWVRPSRSVSQPRGSHQWPGRGSTSRGVWGPDECALRLAHGAAARPVRRSGSPLPAPRCARGWSTLTLGAPGHRDRAGARTQPRIPPPRLQLTLRSAPEPPAPRPGRLSVQSAEAQRTKLRCNSFCDVLTSPPTSNYLQKPNPGAMRREERTASRGARFSDYGSGGSGGAQAHDPQGLQSHVTPTSKLRSNQTLIPQPPKLPSALF